jgi:hypothetical protein
MRSAGGQRYVKEIQVKWKATGDDLGNANVLVSGVRRQIPEIRKALVNRGFGKRNGSNAAKCGHLKLIIMANKNRRLS